MGDGLRCIRRRIAHRVGSYKKLKDTNMASKGFFNAFADVWMHEGVRTPMVTTAAL